MSDKKLKKQKIKLVHSNLYQIYDSEEPAASPVSSTRKSGNLSQPSPRKSVVIKAEEIKNSVLFKPQGANFEEARSQRGLSPYHAKDTSAPVSKPLSPKSDAPPSSSADSIPVALEIMKENLKTLQELNERFRFILTELEQLG